MAQHYARNAERERSKRRAWRKANPNVVHNYNRRYYEKNGDPLRAKARERRQRDLGGHRARAKEWAEKNRGRHLNNMKTWRSKNRGREYGLTPDELRQLEEAQKGICACCGDGPIKLVIDHNHKTGKVRALLCAHCNWAAGHVKDDPLRAELLAAYLRKHS